MLWTNDPELANPGGVDPIPGQPGSGVPLDATASKFVGRTFWAYRYNLMTHIGVDTSREGGVRVRVRVRIRIRFSFLNMGVGICGPRACRVDPSS